MNEKESRETGEMQISDIINWWYSDTYHILKYFNNINLFFYKPLLGSKLVRLLWIGCSCWIRHRCNFLPQSHIQEKLHRNWGVIIYKYMGNIPVENENILFIEMARYMTAF